MSLLTIDHIDAFYGPVQALSQASLRVDQGEIVTLIGANGAGKSSLINAVIGWASRRLPKGVAFCQR